MQVTPYVGALRRDLAAVAAPGGQDVLGAADMLGRRVTGFAQA